MAARETTTTVDAGTPSTICEDLPGGGIKCSLVTTTSVASEVSTTTGDNAVIDALNELEHFVATWNESSLVWVAAYADDSVAFDDYLQISYETEAAQRKALADFVLASNRFPDSMGPGIDAFIANYQARADAFTKIIQAEVAADNDAWSEASAEYFESSNPEESLVIMEGILRTPEIAAALEAEGSSVEEMMDAWRTAFGVGSG